MRFSDSRYLLSPYRIVEQQTEYMFPVNEIVDYTKTDISSKFNRGVRYGPYKHMAPFAFDLVSLLFKMADPSLILSEAQKTVHVSHWGFISVDEYFALENIGAKLKGEFNRVDFHKRDNGKNCMRQITAKYPWYI